MDIPYIDRWPHLAGLINRSVRRGASSHSLMTEDDWFLASLIRFLFPNKKER